MNRIAKDSNPSRVVIRTLRACALLLAPLTLCAPLAAQGVRVNRDLARGAGFAAGDTLAFQLSPDGMWAVFLADPAGDDQMELFSAPADGSASLRKLNGPLTAGGRLVEPLVTKWGVFFDPPDLATTAERVVYRADQDTDEVFELYSVPIDGSAPPVKLSGTLPADGDVGLQFDAAPDGSRVLFVADGVTDETFELYSVPLDGSAPPVRLNAAPVAGGFGYYDLLEARFSPDAQTVVYLLDQATDFVYELYAVPADGGSAPIRLSQALVAGGDVARDFQISPDGATVVYEADAGVNDVTHLWSVPIDGSASPTRLSPPLVAGGDVGLFVLTPDASRVVYLADATLDGRTDVYSVPLGGGPSLLLAAAFSPAGGIFVLRVAAGGARVVYWGDPRADEVYEVFSVPVDGSAPAVRLNGPLVAGGDVGNNVLNTAFELTPDGNRVVYWADQTTLDRMELWSVPVDASAAPVRLSGTLVAGGQVQGGFRCSPDGTRVVYRADQAENERFELWSVPIDGSTAPLRLNERLVGGGDVADTHFASMQTGFLLSADGTRVVYRADQRRNEAFALWSVPSDHARRARELSGPMEQGPALGDVQRFAWASGGRRLLYSADQDVDEQHGVYSVELEASVPGSLQLLGPGFTLQASPAGEHVAFFIRPHCDPVPGCTLAAQLSCAEVDGSPPAFNASAGQGGLPLAFLFDPDGEWLVYHPLRTVYRGPSYDGLFARRTDQSGAAISLTEPPGMLEYLSIRRPVISPDGTRVVFAQGYFTGFAELLSVPIDRSRPPVALNTPFFDHEQEIRPTYRISPDSRVVVYVADQGVPNVFELYRAPLDGSRPSVRLGPQLAPFADVDAAFVLDPQGRRAVYAADLERDGTFELWSVLVEPLRGNAPVRLSQKPVQGGGVALGRELVSGGQDSYVPQPQFALTPDGKRVVYRADADVDEVFELYSAPVDGSAPPVKLNAPLASGPGVPAFGFRLHGGRAVFAALDGAGVLRLFAAPVDGSAAPLALGGAFASGGGLWLSNYDAAALSFELTPDGETVVYLADQRTDEVLELCAAALDGGPARVLNAELVPGGDVRSSDVFPVRPFLIDPTGESVAYLADQETDEVFELFLSALDPSRTRPTDAPGRTVER